MSWIMAEKANQVNQLEIGMFQYGPKSASVSVTMPAREYE